MIYTFKVKHGEHELTFEIGRTRAARTWNRHVRKGGLKPSDHPFHPRAVLQNVITEDGYVEATAEVDRR